MSSCSSVSSVSSSSGWPKGAYYTNGELISLVHKVIDVNKQNLLRQWLEEKGLDPAFIQELMQLE